MPIDSKLQISRRVCYDEENFIDSDGCHRSSRDQGGRFGLAKGRFRFALRQPQELSLVPTGMLTVEAGSPVGFDIYTGLQNDVAVNNSGFASLVVGGVPGFYRVNFLTGQAFLIDYFGDAVIDIAIPLSQN